MLTVFFGSVFSKIEIWTFLVGTEPQYMEEYTERGNSIFSEHTHHGPRPPPARTRTRAPVRADRRAGLHPPPPAPPPDLTSGPFHHPGCLESHPPDKPSRHPSTTHQSFHKLRWVPSYLCIHYPQKLDLYYIICYTYYL